MSAAAFRERVQALEENAIHKLTLRVQALDSDLLRLCGPVCPRDNLRAIEHEIPAPGWKFADGSSIHLNADRHAPWPEGRKWLVKWQRDADERSTK